jgi:hypothetical protein
MDGIEIGKLLDYAMKAYRRSRGIAPLIVNLCVSCR